MKNNKKAVLSQETEQCSVFSPKTNDCSIVIHCIKDLDLNVKL